MGAGFVAVIAAILFLTNGVQNYNHPELSVGFEPSNIEHYVPKAGPDCDADSYSARSDCKR